MTGPMTVLGQNTGLMPAVVRYVEAKALVNGTTTSQGIALFSNAGARRMYRGIVRNVEQTDDAALPEAASHIADVEAVNAQKFLARLQQPHRLLLHLAEGTDAAARAHFRALEYQPGQWAITENLVGIHCAALQPEDFQILAGHGGAMVWSPLSNLLLYGQTADIAAAKQSGLHIGLGADWSVSGSKGLLGELKAARLASAAAGEVFSDRELVAMATRDAATILRWDRALGSLQRGMHADVLVIADTTSDPYSALVDARDRDITLVVIGGIARYGTAGLMHTLVPGDQLEDPGTDGPSGRLLHLHQDSADPVVGTLTLADASARLTGALANLGGPGAPTPHPQAAARPDVELRWQLALDEIHSTGAELRPRLPYRAARGQPARPSGPAIEAAISQPSDLVALTLDSLTATHDPDFQQTLAAEHNLPNGYGPQLTALLR